MDWTEILKRGNVPEPPGRQDALDAAAERSKNRYLRPKAPPKTKKSTRKSR